MTYVFGVLLVQAFIIGIGTAPDVPTIEDLGGGTYRKTMEAQR